MKKLLFLLSVCALFTQSIDAKSITVDQAMAIAKQQFTSSTRFNASNVKMTLGYEATNLKGQSDYYVFNRDGGQGFVIVAGDDMSSPVLAYSTKGSFDINEVPEPLMDLLKAYQHQMDVMRLHPNNAKKPTLNYDLQPYGVYPICGEVHWHQFPPYNNNAPRSSHALTSNGRCYAGCSPIAFATIMKGLRYPRYGVGSFSYNYMLDGQEMTASAKFDDWYYDYGKMKNGYGETQSAMEVSELCYEVGVAFHTIYSGESSDVLLRNVFRGIITFFNYNANIQYVQKSSYQYDEQAWYDIMYNEIDNGRPVYYMGYRVIDNSGNQCHIGHAFVLDGYDSNGKVHVNWGFQPEEYNGYFDWALLSPRNNYEYDAYDSGFNHEQAAIIGLCEDTTGIGGVIVKDVNKVAETMPANDLRLSIDVQSLGGVWNGTLKYGIVSKNSDNTYSPVVTKTASNVEIEDNGTVNLDLSGDYSLYYMSQGRTYYAVVYTPYFTYSTETNWMWFLDDPVPFTIGEWETPPDPQFILGDVDQDGKLSIDDVTALISLLLSEGEYAEVADVNEDGKLGIDDVSALIGLLLNAAPEQ